VTSSSFSLFLAVIALGVSCVVLTFFLLRLRGLFALSVREQSRLQQELTSLQHTLFPLADELKNERAQRSSVEHRLTSQRELLNWLLENASSAILAVEQSGRIILFNKGAEDIFCHGRSEMDGLLFDALLARTNSENQESSITNTQQLLAHGADKPFRTELLMQRSNGEIFPAEASVTPGSIHGQKIFSLIIHDIKERKAFDAQLQQSLREKDVLIREIHHRVKNNLQIIYSLLNLQSRNTTDDAAITVLKQSQNRIKSIALIYETLYQSTQLERIDFHAYAQSLLNNLSRAWQTTHVLTVENHQPPISLSLDSSVPCGLIINELVSNSLQHAFSSEESGEVAVRLAKSEDEVLVLTVRDTGKGFPEAFNLESLRTLGLRLVTNLTKQLGGTLEFGSDGGALVSVRFKEA